jgi:sterol 3beta-glucosyltransferase
MKIVIVTSGSRGDVQPYCALGLELASRGHSVTLCTERRMESFVKTFPGIE